MSSKGIQKKTKAVDATKKLAEKIKKQALKQKALASASSAASTKESLPVSETISISTSETPVSDVSELSNKEDLSTKKDQSSASSSSSTSSSSSPPSVQSFTEFDLVPELLESIQSLKYTQPTPIQAAAIPHALQGKDIVGIAETGSGKTAAFAIPILQTLYTAAQPYYALVLAPTRELAFQIKETFDALGSSMGLRSVCIIGGMSMMEQARDLMRKPHVIIATPGRLIDHLEHTKGFSLKKLQYLVMDEVDRMIDLDYAKAIDQILKQIPSHQRITYLYTATMSREIEKFKRSLNSPVQVEIVKSEKVPDKLKQTMCLTSPNTKDTRLIQIVNSDSMKRVIIFTRTVVHTRRCCLMLLNLGFKCVELHGQMPQSRRLGAINKFKAGTPILVATDVAARGLDIPAVDLVINYDIPDPTSYIHRVGRTARAGKAGKAISLVTQYDLESYLRIENTLGTKLPKEDLPLDEMQGLQVSVDRALSKAIQMLRNEENDNKSRHRGRSNNK
ncbi:ribosomal RNA processing protein [Lodderomyces elongisporus]|uniref:ribosomal RNA processing protein n=1 Tax=Lodderomyces elongisporus TaxID=36914 RepID=UPI002920F766|nr:ribosomal RNA processing protein [Lodderomyces elongisporus]WLF78708.1 ribosomal RNA processing protein [Lodderomyces elongisporus]